MRQDFLIQDLTTLRKIIPEYPKLMDRRIKNSLDSLAIEFLNAANLAVFSSSQLKTIEILPLSSGTVGQPDSRTLSLKIAQQYVFAPDKTETTADTLHACTLYFLVNGIGHGLRINGKARILPKHSHEAMLEINIEQVYFHCSRAIVRAGFWQIGSEQLSTKDQATIHQTTICQTSIQQKLCADSKTFIANSPFLFICSRNTQEKLEISPRGDAAGFVRILSDDTLLIPERPGNKVAITLRNILEQTQVKLLLFIPNRNLVLQVKGNAVLTHQPDYLEQLCVNSKRPKLAVSVKIQSCQLIESTALEQANLWDIKTHRSADELSSFAKIMNTHLHGESLIAKTFQPVVNAIIQRDLKNLY